MLFFRGTVCRRVRLTGHWRVRKLMTHGSMPTRRFGVLHCFFVLSVFVMMRGLQMMMRGGLILRGGLEMR